MVAILVFQRRFDVEAVLRHSWQGRLTNSGEIKSPTLESRTFPLKFRLNSTRYSTFAGSVGRPSLCIPSQRRNRTFIFFFLPLFSFLFPYIFPWLDLNLPPRKEFSSCNTLKRIEIISSPCVFYLKMNNLIIEKNVWYIIISLIITKNYIC